MHLSQKESSLLEEMKEQEKLCIEKYSKHARCAHDGQLKNLFTQLASAEGQHLSYFDQIGEGTIPQVATAGGSIPSSFTACYTSETPEKHDDCYLCTDLLSSEKHASALYDTCVFEFRDEGIRNVFNAIQKQEQNHGKTLYDYMSVNGMYPVK